MGTVHYHIQEVTPADRPRLAELLAANQQSTQDILAPRTRYWLAEDGDGQAIGTIGIELGTDSILLRSAAVLPPWRGHGIGTALVQHALEAARQAGFKQAYLFSRRAGSYWRRFGFSEVPVTKVVAALPAVPQVKHYLQTGTIWADVAWQCNLTDRRAEYGGEPLHPA